MIANYAASRLRLEALDPNLWRDVNYLDLKKLWEYLAYYLYLPRIKNQQVLLQENCRVLKFSNQGFEQE